MSDQWEYKEVVIRFDEDRVAILNKLGAEGWEVVSMEDYGEGFLSQYHKVGVQYHIVGVKVLLKRHKP